ncbi:pyridoxamine 5'-phosphate oxidase family protein [Nakamurella leprariae]|uniref:Pyridoxamine 5'-phosphate oxidase family protein n=1 Tax=Nakamurella leprariae TaxID=2803911 RepID=A0A939C232_9ACTN|nr:pyridoxamine 5'-phosphate oxidase family protein [Nakamurella leprariae]MBM9467799.1 pyridoxamine 5'-phosphate oxidase family protein [Nakamurella leprariae]
MTEAAELQTLTDEECTELLSARTVGRLGVMVERYPLILPVNYTLDRGVVVIRSRPGTKLTNASHANVTFQVDDFDTVTRTGWSVLVRGQAEELTDRHSEEVRERTETSGLQPWVADADLRWVRIIPHGVTGRRIVVPPGAEQDWAYGIGAYM